MTRQVCYGGVRLLGEGPSMTNVARLDRGALPMIHAMASRGIQVDVSHFARMARILTQDMERITEEVKDIAGYYVNPGSGDQVSDLLFKKLGLKQPRQKFTKSGKRESVENDVLVSVQHQHPIVSKLLDYKEFEKLRGTYAEPIQTLAKRTDKGTWRLYPRFKTTRIPSGRFACDEPNTLAMPNRTERGRELLKGFITDPGWCFLSVDESQIEPRTVAHRSQDRNLMNVYLNEEDLYSDFGTDAFKLPDERYRDETGWHYPTIHKKLHRFPAKTCVLASIYRVTNKGLVEQMPVICKHCFIEASKHTSDCPKFQALWQEDNCQDIINAFYLRYPGITKMQRIDDARARKHSFLWDDWGRMLHTTAVRSVHEWVVSAALREAGNMPVQGFACGTLKLVMAQVQDELEAAGMYGEVWWPLLPIHDEILSEVREDVAQEIGEHIAERFRTCVELTVPLKAEWATANTWGAIQK